MSETNSADPRIGAILDGRYRIQRRLSSGAMGVVYQGERLALGRAVAVKFLHPYFAQVKDFTRRFEREALTMSRLNHPNCVSVIDFGMSDGPYIVMDYVEGRPLSDLVEDGPLPARRAVAIMRQVLAGLAHAHEQGIIHRDVKPANVMLTAATGAGDHVQLLDFGLAKLRDVDMSASGVVAGTPSYMSPEQASYKQLDGRSDVYSAGVMLFELLTGSKPFRADEAFAIIRMHLETAPPSLAELRPDLEFSPALERAVARALAKEPDQRFQSPIELGQALEAALDGSAEAEVARPVTDPALAPTRLGLPPAAPASEPGRGEEARDAAPETPPSAVEVAPARRRSRIAPLLGLLVVAAAVWAFAGAPGLPEEWRQRAEQRGRSALALPEPASAEPPAVAGLAGVRRMIAAGETEPAIQELHRLRRADAGDAEVSYLLGRLYADKGWSVEALAAYREALHHDPEYRNRAELVRDAIDALDHPRAGDEAHVLLVEGIGEAALDELRRAVSGGRPAVAKAARKTVADIEARRSRQGRE